MKKIINEVESILTFKNVLKFTMMFIASGVAFMGILYLIFTSTDKQQKIECLQYQQYARELTGFWISAEDSVACDAVGIYVNAPIH